MKLAKNEMRHWIEVGFHLVRLQILKDSNLQKVQGAFMESSKEIVSKIDPKAIASTEDYKAFFNGVLNFYEKDEDVFSCICFGIAITRCLKIVAGSSMIDAETIKENTLRVVEMTYLTKDEQKTVFDIIWRHWKTKKELPKFKNNKMTFAEVVSENWGFDLDYFTHIFYKALYKKEEVGTNVAYAQKSDLTKFDENQIASVQKEKPKMQMENVQSVRFPMANKKEISSISVKDALNEKYLFISYSSRDYELVSKIKQAIENAGVKCWMAPDSIRVGEDYSEVIVDAIENSSGVIFCVTENSQASKWVPKELDIAIGADKIVYPIHLDESLILKNIRFRIINCQMIEFQGNIENKLANLLRAIDSV